MKSIILILSLLGLLASTAVANDLPIQTPVVEAPDAPEPDVTDDDLGLGEPPIDIDLDLFRSGYPEAPVILCPQPKKKYTDMLAALDTITTKIATEACPKSKIEAINKQVTSLKTLVQNGGKKLQTQLQNRPTQLVPQGGNNFIDRPIRNTSSDKKTPPRLTVSQVTKTQAYIDKVIKTTAVITGLVNNPACFDEVEKVSTLSLLSSIVGQVSSVVGSFAGPFGAKISMGGRLAGTLLGSINSIVQARQTYDYDKFDDRKNYLTNLCAYTIFKNDIDKETDTFLYMDRLYEMLDASDSLLAHLSLRCPECAAAIEDYNSRLEANQEAFVVSRMKVGNQMIATSPTLASASGRGTEPEIILTADMTEQDLYDYYFTSREVRFGGLEVPAPRYQDINDDGSTRETNLAAREATIRALQSKAWVENEIKLLAEADLEGISDDGRREVIRVQEQIEDFLVNREATRYIKAYEKLLKKDFADLRRITTHVRMRLNHLHLLRDETYDYAAQKDTTVNDIHDIFRSNQKYNPLFNEPDYTEVKKELFRQARRDVLDQINTVRVDYNILLDRCEYFRKGPYKHNQAMVSACDRMDYKQRHITAFFEGLTKTAFNKRYAPFLAFVNKEPKNYVEDWMASTTAVLQLNKEMF